MKNPSMKSISQQWQILQNRVQAGALRSGRSIDSVKVIGVTKYADFQASRWLFDAGCRDFGESRPQALWDKVAILSDLPLRWHFIGHLQRNKSLKTVGHLSMLHSLDSIRLAEQVHFDAEKLGISISCLIEVNISGEPNKTGVSREECLGFLESLASLPRIRVVGIMGMAGLSTSDPRIDFAKLRILRDEARRLFGNAFTLSELSMGMSGDFEAAIEEGSTMVRIGSFLFEPSEN